MIKLTKEYPLTYTQVRDKLLDMFVNYDWEYKRDFTKEQKQEFLDNFNFDFHEAYRDECRNYDEGRPNIFTGDEGVYYILGLLEECNLYYISKETIEDTSEEKVIDESKYPMTYEQFKEKILEILIRNVSQQYGDSAEKITEDYNKYLNEVSPKHVWYDYVERCEMYDLALEHPEKANIPLEYVFDDASLSGGPVHVLEGWMYFLESV